LWTCAIIHHFINTMLHKDKERQIMVFLSKLAKTTFSKSQQGVIPHAFYLCLCYSASISSVIHYSIQNPICHSALFPFVTPHTPSCHSRDIFLSFPPPSLSFRAIAGIQEVFLFEYKRKKNRFLLWSEKTKKEVNTGFLNSWFRGWQNPTIVPEEAHL